MLGHSELAVPNSVMLIVSSPARVSLQLFARAGYSVVVYDILFSEQAKIDECLKAIYDQLVSMEQENLLWNQGAEEVKGRITAVHSLEEAIKGAVYVQVQVSTNRVHLH